MNNSDYREIGTLAKLHGFKGEYVMVSDIMISEEIEDWESVFIEIDGLPVPFFIESLRITSDSSVVIGFEDIKSEDAAKEFLGNKVFQLFSVADYAEETVFSQELSGYLVTDKKFGKIGMVDQLLDFNHNLLLQIMNGEEEILIPVSGEIVVNVNHEEKTILIDAPEGLIHLNR
jgi:16S rRNA processing protein RimM